MSRISAVAMDRDTGFSTLANWRYAPMALVLFPLAILAVDRGGWVSVAFVFAVMLLHILLDNLTEDLDAPRSRATWPHNLWLLAQFPTAVALLALLLIKCAEGAVAQRLGLTPYASGGEIAGAVVATSFMFGGNTVVSHEMMHRPSRWSRAYAWVLLTITGDGQFLIAHLHGHHQNVGFRKDPATARRGESLYRFFVRSSIGQYRESLNFERRRLSARGGRVSLLQNRVVASATGSMALVVLVGAILGYRAGIAYLSVMLVSKLFLEVINYIQHYGLVREPGCPVLNRHSWDCRGRGAGTILFGLSFHAAHHAQPVKPMWDLRGAEGAPNLTHGYMFAMLVAFLPPLWYRYTRQRLAEWDGRLATDGERALLVSAQH